MPLNLRSAGVKYLKRPFIVFYFYPGVLEQIQSRHLNSFQRFFGQTVQAPGDVLRYTMIDRR
jgi:hypothetical protein